MNPVGVMRLVGQETLDAVTDVRRAITSSVSLVHGRAPVMAEVSGIMTEEELDRKEKKREAGEARDDFRYYFNAELVTEQEWQRLESEEAHGSQKWRTLYTWCATAQLRQGWGCSPLSTLALASLALVRLPKTRAPRCYAAQPHHSRKH